jgi:hypothetical protein
VVRGDFLSITLRRPTDAGKVNVHLPWDTQGKLKIRAWPETKAFLKNLVAAAKVLRAAVTA